MLNILVLTKNHPVEILDIVTRLYNSLGQLDAGIYIGSPQVIAQMVSQTKGVPYLQTYYPAMRSYRLATQFAADNGIDTIVTVGAVDIHDLNTYDAIIGIDNPEMEDYPFFDEDFNTDGAISTTLKQAELLFETVDEIIHFIRIVRKEKQKENDENELQQTSARGNK